MEQWQLDLNKLESFMNQVAPLGLVDPSVTTGAQKRRYKLDYVNTVKFNPKSGQFEPYDKRTKSFYNEAEANKYIADNVRKSRKKYFLKGVGTETPQKDLKYLYAKNKLENLKNSKNTSVWKIRNSLSNKIEGGGTVYEQEWLQDIKNAEAKLLKLRAGTKYEREILKQIKAKRDAQ